MMRLSIQEILNDSSRHTHRIVDPAGGLEPRAFAIVHTSGEWSFTEDLLEGSEAFGPGTVFRCSDRPVFNPPARDGTSQGEGVHDYGSAARANSPDAESSGACTILPES